MILNLKTGDFAMQELCEPLLSDIQRKTVVAAVNKFWSEYLEYTEYMRRGIHLVEVGGKNPAEEYNIAAEEYYQAMEGELKAYAEMRLDELLDNGDENYYIETPKNIRTYLLEDTGDELNKKPFLVNFLSDETERELAEQETKKALSFENDTLSLFDDNSQSAEEKENAGKEITENPPKKEEKKKGFLFWRKK